MSQAEGLRWGEKEKEQCCKIWCCNIKESIVVCANCPLVFLQADGSQGRWEVREAILREHIKGGFNIHIAWEPCEATCRKRTHMGTSIFRILGLGSPSSWWVHVCVPSVGRGRKGGRGHHCHAKNKATRAVTVTRN